MAEPVRDPVDDRELQAVMVQDGGEDEGRERRLGPGHGLGLLPQPGPDGIDHSGQGLGRLIRAHPHM